MPPRTLRWGLRHVGLPADYQQEASGQRPGLPGTLRRARAEARMSRPTSTFSRNAEIHKHSKKYAELARTAD